MTPLTDKTRRWLQKNGSQKVKVTWCNGFVDNYTYEARMIDWSDKPPVFYVTHVQQSKGD